MLRESIHVNILVVEDDRLLGMAIQRALERLAHDVRWVRTCADALEALREPGERIALIDLGLPDGDGLDLLATVRSEGNTTPVIIMTARSDVSAKVRGLDAGADDYLGKPFHLDELVARIRSVARRVQSRADHVLLAGDLRLNLDTSQLYLRSEQVVLTPREYALLRALMERAGRIVQRDTIERLVYGDEKTVGANAMEVLVHGLRKKLGADVIQTIRGEGYLLAPGGP